MSMRKQTLFKRSLWAVLLGVVVYALILAFSDFQALWTAVRSMRASDLLLILLIIPVNYITRYFKFHYYLRVLGIRVRLKDEIIALLASFVMVITPAKVGEMLLKGYMLNKKYDMPMSTTVALIFAERLTDGLAMVLLAVAALAMMQTAYGLVGVACVGALLLAFVLVVQSRPLCHKVLAVAGRIRVFKKYADLFGTFYESAYEIFRIKPLLVAVGWGMAAWLCEGMVVYLTVGALRGALLIEQAIFVVAFSGIAGAVSMAPGGLVVADGTILGLLLYMGASKTIAGATTIVSRFSTIWLGVLAGSVALLFAKRNGLWGSTANENMRDMCDENSR